jgi:hypothetical protein
MGPNLYEVTEGKKLEADVESLREVLYWTSVKSKQLLESTKNLREAFVTISETVKSYGNQRLLTYTVKDLVEASYEIGDAIRDKNPKVAVEKFDAETGRMWDAATRVRRVVKDLGGPMNFSESTPAYEVFRRMHTAIDKKLRKLVGPYAEAVREKFGSEPSEGDWTTRRWAIGAVASAILQKETTGVWPTKRRRERIYLSPTTRTAPVERRVGAPPLPSVGRLLPERQERPQVEPEPDHVEASPDHIEVGPENSAEPTTAPDALAALGAPDSQWILKERPPITSIKIVIVRDDAILLVTDSGVYADETMTNRALVKAVLQWMQRKIPILVRE